MARRTLGGTRHHRDIDDFGIGYSSLSYLGSIFGNGLTIIPRFWLFSIRCGAVFSGDPPIGIHH